MMRQSEILRRLMRIEWFSMGAVLLLILLGIMFIYSAGFHGPDIPVEPFYKKQIVLSFVGLAVLLSVAVLDYRKICERALLWYGLGLLSLVLVLFVGVEIHGAHRWIRILGVTVQPSEYAKIATIVMMARLLGRPGVNLRDPSQLYTVLGIAAIPFGLIAIEPDLGTAAVLIPITFVMLFQAGVPLRMLLILLFLGILLMPLGWFTLGDYQKDRVLVFLEPGRDPLGAGWNKIQSEIAVGSGGMMGKGFLKGTQNVLGYLPRTVAPTDFIFSVIAEESGFAGSLILMGLYVGVLGAGVKAALCARDKVGQLLATGVVTLLGAHTVVNIAMTIGLMPITGLPLPLISYGGSFMVSTMLSLGLVQSVYIRRFSH